MQKFQFNPNVSFQLERYLSFAFHRVSAEMDFEKIVCNLKKIGENVIAVILNCITKNLKIMIKSHFQLLREIHIQSTDNDVFYF